MPARKIIQIFVMLVVAVNNAWDFHDASRMDDNQNCKGEENGDDQTWLIPLKCTNHVWRYHLSQLSILEAPMGESMHWIPFSASSSHFKCLLVCFGRECHRRLLLTFERVADGTSENGGEREKKRYSCVNCVDACNTKSNHPTQTHKHKKINK